MRFKRAGLITKIVIMVLMIYMTVSLLNLRTQIQQVQDQKTLLTAQVAAQNV